MTPMANRLAGTTRLLTYMKQQELLTEDLFLVDVGCSTGIEPLFRAFEPLLAGLGVDPLVNEIERLRQIEQNSKFHYVDAALVGGRPPASQADTPDESAMAWFARSSAYETQVIANRRAAVGAFEAADNYVLEHYNAGRPLVFAERQLTLSDLLKEHGVSYVDLLKIDTDGFDVQVLIGGAPFLCRSPPLLTMVETFFNGSVERNENVLPGVDAVLRPWGLTLLDIDVWRYSRAALPSPYAFDLAAQTQRGPVGFCDVYYYDDPLSRPDKLDEWLPDRLQRCFKLLALYEMHGLQDCAAELIQHLKTYAASADAADWDAMLDLLVPPNPAGANTYKEYIRFFEEHPTRFYRCNWDV